MAKEYPGYFSEVASFLRGSWVQVPDGTSSSRFMRPRYAVKKTETGHGNIPNRQFGSDSASLPNRENREDRSPGEIQEEGANHSDQGSNLKGKGNMTSSSCNIGTKKTPLEAAAIYVSVHYQQTYPLLNNGTRCPIYIFQGT